MSLYLGDTPIAGLSERTKYNAHHLLDFKWTDCIMNDVSWLRADTFSWQSGGVYVAAYNHLVADLSGATSETETIGSYTVTFYRATDGHKICLANQETTVLNIYNETGVAWYYIVDTVNTIFKLPRTKFGFEGVRNNVGDLIAESLPNITGFINGASYGVGGSFQTTSDGSANWGTGGFNYGEISFDASRSSSTYQNNAPVQERATQMYLYFYVGDFSQTATEQTAGLNSSLFNGKADLNLANVSNAGSSLGASWSMPSGIYDDLTLGASGTEYTAPANGWYYARKERSDLQYFLFNNITKGYSINYAPDGGNTVYGIFPVCKGDVVSIAYTTSGTTRAFRFYYAVGSESEA